MTCRPSRRELLASAGAGLFAGLLSAQEQPPKRTAEPELVVLNAQVITVDPSIARAQAFAVRNGRFAAVGSDADIK